MTDIALEALRHEMRAQTWAILAAAEQDGAMRERYLERKNDEMMEADQIAKGNNPLLEALKKAKLVIQSRANTDEWERLADAALDDIMAAIEGAT